MGQSELFDSLDDLSQVWKDFGLVGVVEYDNAPGAQDPQRIIDPVTRVEMVAVTENEIESLGLTTRDELYLG